MYRPLHKSLTIKKSKIEGLGLFAKDNINNGELLGVSHVAHKDYEDGYIRTPLGGFYNHSTEPNVVSIKLPNGDLALITLRKIKTGEEITATYKLYDPSK